jgi:hypothetical protein
MPQNCNFGKAKRKLAEDGPGGPKHVGANVEKCLIEDLAIICLIKGAFVGERNCDVIEMHGMTIKQNQTIQFHH